MIYFPVIFILGSVLGSVMTMLYYRLPLELPITFDRSKCPHCQHVLGVLSLLPVISYLCQKGKCRYCHTPISFFYLLIELLMILFTSLLYIKYGFSFLFLKLWVYLFFMLTLFFIDIRTYLLPDKLTIPVFVLGLVFAYPLLVKHLVAAIIGAAILMGIRFLGNLIYKTETMGLGDVKLAAAIGAFWGTTHILLTLYLSFIIGGMLAIFVMIFTKKGRKECMPFGPAIILSSALSFFYGESLIQFLLCLKF